MRSLVFLLLLGLLSNCQREEPSPYADVVTCGIRNPAQNLPWLRKRIQDGIDVVTATTYKGETYFNLYQYHWSCALCYVYRCDGSRVGISQLSPTDQQEIGQRLFFTNDEYVIYKRTP